MPAEHLTLETDQRAPRAYSTHGSKPSALEEGTRRPRFELASPLGPEATEQSPDRTFAVEALHTAREGWNEMQQTHPDFYKGMTVYGSLVKGRGHEKSDLDAVIFYDPEAPYAQSFDNYTDMLMQPNKDLQQHMGARFRQGGYSETFQGVGSYTKAPMNEQIIEGAITWAEKAQERQPDNDSGIGSYLPELFYMRVGNGDIQSYRQRVVDQLTHSPHGEAIWGEIMDELKTKEEMRRGADIVIPQTLEEGRQYFNLHDTEPLEAVPEKPSDEQTKPRRKLGRFIFGRSPTAK